MNPFDLKAALLAGHTQRVVLIHFPIALFITSVAFDVIACFTRSRSLARAAYYNLIGTALMALPAVVTGVVAWQLQLEGAKLKGNLRSHLVLGASSAALIWVLAWWRRAQERRDRGSLAVGYRKPIKHRTTVFYHDGEKFARTYFDKIRAHRFAKRQQASPVVARTRVLQVA
jgi:uncharacterized membrane protein